MHRPLLPPFSIACGGAEYVIDGRFGEGVIAAFARSDGVDEGLHGERALVFADFVGDLNFVVGIVAGAGAGFAEPVVVERNGLVRILGFEEALAVL